MKRFILFLFVLFFAFSSNIKAQTIDSLVITQALSCPGTTGELTVYINQTVPLTNYTVVLQMMTNTGTWQGAVPAIANTTQTSFVFGTNPLFPLFAGNYRVLLLDVSYPLPYPTAAANNCPPANPLIFDCESQGLFGPNTISLPIATAQDLDCWYDTTSVVTLSIIGLSPPYTVTLNNLTTGTSQGPITVPNSGISTPFPTQSAGLYSVIVDDFFNCGPILDSFEIIAADTLTSDTTVNQITCHDDDNGQISLVVDGGTGQGTYTYEWFDAVTGLPIVPANTSNPTGNVLPPGQYYAVITDSNSCQINSDTTTLTNPPMLTATVDTLGSNACNGDCNVIISVSIDSIGSGPPYMYNLNGGPFGSSPTFSNQGQCAGSYSVIVRDVNGCLSDTVIPDPIIIPEPDPITVYLSAKDYTGYQVSCFNICDAEITIDSVQGGNLSPYGTSLPYLGLVAFSPDTVIDSAFCAGSYTLTVTDDLGCTGDGSIIITEPPIFSISASIAPNPSGFDVSCPGECDGIVNVTPNNGIGTINYFIENSNFANDISPNIVQATGVCGFNTNGEDTIIAIDANGCADTTYTQLSEPPLFIWSMGAVMENCDNVNGEASINITQGGTSPYTYNWSGPFGNNSVAPSNNIQGNTDTITSLTYGWYVVSVTDAAGCLGVVDSALVLEGDIDVDVSVSVPCNDSSGVITLSNNNPFPLTSIVWTNETDVVWDPNGCNGIGCNVPVILQNDSNFTISVLENVSSQEYYYQIQQTGCPPVGPDTVVVGPGVTMDASLDVFNSVLDLDCFGDMTESIIIHVVDGFNASNSPNNNSFNAYTIIPTYNVAISDAPLGDNNFLQSGGTLPAGNYDIVITPNMFDALLNPLFTNCMDTVTVTVTEPDSLEFTLGSVQTLCYGDSTGSAHVDTIFGGNSGEYNYTWIDSDSTIVGNTNSISGLPAGWYYLSVTDSLNCLPPAIDSVEITSPTEISWTITVTAIDSCEYTNPVGSIVLTSAGGMGAHSYAWNGLDASGNPLNPTTPNISGLTSGMFYITITDTNSCTKNDSVFIENGQNPALDSNSFTNVSCAGANDGSYIAVVDSVNGSLSFPYTFWNFNLTPPNWDPGYIPSASSLGPGDIIYIRLKDNFGCVDSSTYVITEPDTLIIQSVTPLVFPGDSNISCYGYLDGAIDIDSVSGGTMPYYYSINGFYNTDSTDHFFDTLAAAWYYCDIIDANGCTYRDSIILTQPDLLLVDSFSTSAYIGGLSVSCNGFNDGSAIAYVSGGIWDGVIYTYTYSWSNNDNLAFTDTLSGDSWYTVSVTDTNGCHTLDSVYITEPTPLVIDIITSDSVLCVGGDRGTATVFVSGATPNYYYLWNNEDLTSPTYVNPNDTVGSNNDTTATADTLRSGVYIVEVWDENGCYITDSIEIFEPSISVEIDSLVIEQITCFTYDDASVTIITTGPQPLPYYYYLYDPLNPTDTAYQGNLGFNAGLAPGNYVAMVEDDLGCLDRDTFEIYNLDEVVINNVTAINISCNGYNDGYIQNISPAGGTPPYTYSVDGGLEYSSWICNVLNPGCTNINGTGYVFTGLTPGTHTVEIWDSNRCANSFIITITEPTAIQFAISTNSYYNYSIACNGGTDEASIVVSGGVSPYDITLNGITNTTLNTYTWTGIYAGSQTFVIEDAAGCMVDTTIIFTQPDLIDTVSSIINKIFCSDSCDGSITAIISGGVGMGIGTNYTYQWYDGAGTTSPIVGETSYTINNLCAGVYTLEVTDNNNCSEIFTWNLNSNVLAIDVPASNFSITNVTCYEDCDGSISVVVNGGVPPYTYLWNDVLSQTSQTAVGLCANPLVPYTCTVTDDAGCQVSFSDIITEPSELVAGITVAEEIDCNGNSTGELQSTTTGGTPPYTYLWSNGGTTASIGGLSAGQYSLFITDANGCTDTALYNLEEPAVLDILLANIIVADVNCFNGCDGSITVTATGGSPTPGIPGTYDYELYDASGSLVATLTNFVSATFNGLCTGIYTVTVTDANDCPYTTSDIFVDEPEEALSLVLDASNGTCNTSASVIAYVAGGTPTNSVGCSGYTYVWSNENGTTTGITNPNSNATDVAAQGYTNYYLTVTDCNGCTISGSASVRDYDNIFLPDYSDSYDTTICLGGQLNINVAECIGCSYFWYHNGVIIANTSSLSVIPDTSWSPLEILTLGISDPACAAAVTVTATISIEPLIPACSASTLTPTKSESVTLTSNSSFSTYLWTNSSGEILSQNNEFIINPEKSDCYDLYVEDGVCKGYCSLCLAVGSAPYTAFSPNNGDNFNNYWYIKDIELFDGSIVQIFNRWGTLIFEKKNCPTACWDGMIDGKDAPVGTYYYSIDHNDGSELLQGTITLVR